MSLSTQRVASVAVLAIAAGGLLWSEYSGGNGGPTQAGAAQPPSGQLDAATTKDTTSEQQGFRVALAGMFRDYAQRNAIQADSIDDPFITPVSWSQATSAPIVLPDTPAARQDHPPMNLTALLDAPGGAVARVNGVVLVLGKPMHLHGVGLVELIEVGGDRRSALIQTEHGMIRLRLQMLITPDGT